MSDWSFGNFLGTKKAERKQRSYLGGLVKSEAAESGEKEVEDLFNLLPDPIIVIILSLLPLAVAVKTSTLSKRWRYLWTTIPDLDLFEFFLSYKPSVSPSHIIPQARYEQTHLEVMKYISIIYQIFHFRSVRASIQSCDLPVFSSEECPFQLDNFLLFLHRLGNKNLILRNVGRYDNILLSDLYFFRALKELIIIDFGIFFPSEFKALTNLRTLKLFRVRISNQRLEILVSHCPNLEMLVLRDCMWLRDFQIRAANLLWLGIGINEKLSYSLIDAPRLKHLALYNARGSFDDFCDPLGDEENDHRNYKDEAAKLVELFLNSCQLERISFNCDLQIFEYASIKGLLDMNIECQLVHMKELSLSLSFDDPMMLSILLFLLRSCPSLQQLCLQARGSSAGPAPKIDYWENQRAPQCLINHLTSIQMKYISLNSINWFAFVKFILLNARVLNRMRIFCNIASGFGLKRSTLKKLLRLERASPHALLEINAR